MINSWNFQGRHHHEMKAEKFPVEPDKPMGRDSILAHLGLNLQGPKPGWPVQLTMGPEPREGSRKVEETDETCSWAAVMLLLYPRQQHFEMVLTRRSNLVLHHQSQISFPGGRREEGETFLQTALRETKEELGIDLGDIHILGELTPLFIPPSNICIRPLVARLPERPNFHPSRDEVAEILEIPLLHLLDEKNRRREIWIRDDKRIQVPFFDFKGNKIWGATAMVLAEFLDLLEHPAPDPGAGF